MHPSMDLPVGPEDCGWHCILDLAAFDCDLLAFDLDLLAFGLDLAAVGLDLEVVDLDLACVLDSVSAERYAV